MTRPAVRSALINILAEVEREMARDRPRTARWRLNQANDRFHNGAQLTIPEFRWPS
jgi:hypothetical protein